MFLMLIIWKWLHFLNLEIIKPSWKLIQPQNQHMEGYLFVVLNLFLKRDFCFGGIWILQNNDRVFIYIYIYLVCYHLGELEKRKMIFDRVNLLFFFVGNHFRLADSQ